jgi:hypothetical protein
MEQDQLEVIINEGDSCHRGASWFELVVRAGWCWAGTPLILRPGVLPEGAVTVTRLLDLLDSETAEDKDRT